MLLDLLENKEYATNDYTILAYEYGIYFKNNIKT